MRRLVWIVPAVALLAGCNTSSTSTPPPPPQFLYVGNCNGAASSITVYPAAVTSDTAPLRTITSAELTTCALGLAVDNAGDIFAGLYSGGHLLEFGPGASGSSTPIHSITGLAPLGVAIGPDGNTYVGSTTPTLSVFAPGADGAATPMRTFSVSGAGMARAEYPAFDPLGNLWLSDESTGIVAAFPPTATGTPTPLHKIFGLNTGIIQSYGLGFDPAGDILVADFNATSVSIFGPAQDGNVAPLRAIKGLATTLNTPYVPQVNRAGTIFVSNNGTNSVLIFAPNANGNMAPEGQITTGVMSPWGLAIH